MIISLEVRKFGRLHIVRDDDTFGTLEGYPLCVMMIRLEVGKLGSLEVYTVCVMVIGLEVGKLGSLEVYTVCVMMISLEVWRFTGVHIVCDDGRLGSLRA